MTNRPTAFRFRLRSVFVFITAVALFSEVMRFALGLGESPFVISMASFAYGGLVGLMCFAFFGVLSVLVSRNIRARFVVMVIGAIAATAVWMGVIIFVTHHWVPMCVLFSCLACVLIILTVRNELAEQANQQLHPEVTLKRLRRAKDEANVESLLGRQTLRKE